MIRKDSRQKDLDRLGQTVVRASALSDEDAAEMAVSPFLFTRVRAQIASAGDAQLTGGIWTNFSLIARKAIPAMSLAAAVSLGLFLYTRNNSTKPTFSVDAYLGTSEPGIERLVFSERQPVTVDEVLATIVTRDEREPAR